MRESAKHEFADTPGSQKSARVAVSFEGLFCGIELVIDFVVVINHAPRVLKISTGSQQMTPIWVREEPTEVLLVLNEYNIFTFVRQTASDIVTSSTLSYTIKTLRPRFG
jgi:hypothetical protein